MNQTDNPTEKLTVERIMLPNIKNPHILTHEDSVKGGLSRTERKKIVNQLKAQKRSKCKNCHIGCPFRTGLMEKDLESLCKVPEAKKLMLMIGTDRKYVMEKLKLLLFDMDLKAQGIKDQHLVYNDLVEFSKQIYPITSKIELKGDLNIDGMLKPGDIFLIAQESEVKKKENATKDKPVNSPASNS